MSAPRKRAATKTAAVAQQSQRDRLLGRPRPSLPYPLLVDPDRVETARAELARVQQRVRQVVLKEEPGNARYRRAEKSIRDAEAVVDGCYETLILRALPTRGEVTTERLIAAHPPTDAQMAAAKLEREKAKTRGEDLPPWPDWDDDTLRPALLAACAEGGMSEQDWTEFLAGHVSDGEARALWLACLAVNERERVADPLVLPKGWTGIRS
jgi:hypothetical protein